MVLTYPVLHLIVLEFVACDFTVQYTTGIYLCLTTDCIMYVFVLVQWLHFSVDSSCHCFVASIKKWRGCVVNTPHTGHFIVTTTDRHIVNDLDVTCVTAVIFYKRKEYQYVKRRHWKHPVIIHILPLKSKKCAGIHGNTCISFLATKQRQPPSTEK